MWNVKVIAWYDYQSGQKKWEICDDEESFYETMQVAQIECDSTFGVMIFDYESVLNKNDEIPFAQFIKEWLWIWKPADENEEAILNRWKWNDSHYVQTLVDDYKEHAKGENVMLLTQWLKGRLELEARQMNM